MNKLLYVDDCDRTGEVNMAIDDLLGKREILLQFDFILRTYFWHKPTLSCGYHQKPRNRLNFDGCFQHGVEMVRRSTGGRELLHDGDMSFSITGSMEALARNNITGAKEFFIKAAEVIVGGLQEIGVDAEVTAGHKKSSGTESAPCLAAISQYEIVSSGKKIIPMAQRIYPEAIMVHGSIPVVTSRIPTSDLLISRKAERLQALIDESSTDLERILKGKVNLSILKAGIKKAFDSNFNGDAVIAGIPDELMNKIENEKKKWRIKED